MARSSACSMWSPSPTLLVAPLMDTMGLASPPLNVHPKVVQHLEPVPPRLGSVACSRSLVEKLTPSLKSRGFMSTEIGVALGWRH